MPIRITRGVLPIMYSTLYKVLNLLFPKRGMGIIYGIFNPQINELYSYANVFYSLRYKDTHTKKVLWKFKYYLDPEALRICTYILYDQLIADASDRVTQIPFRAPYIVLHYPSSSYFKGNKKFDHMKELTLLLDSLQNMNEPFFIYCTHAILPNQKVGQSLKSQHTGTRRQRFEWSNQRFVLSPDFERFMKSHRKLTRDSDQSAMEMHVSHTSHTYKTHMYCIDDIVTTGASMQAVSDILQDKYNVKISKFCVCH